MMKSKLLTPVIEVLIYLATWPQYGRKKTLVVEMKL